LAWAGELKASVEWRASVQLASLKLAENPFCILQATRTASFLFRSGKSDSLLG